jgi:hypothetical protein
MRVFSWLLIGLLPACGGDSGEPLVAGSLTAEYAGVPYVPAFGFATLYQGGGLIALGDGPLHCGSESSNAPPSGDNAVASLDLEVGTHSGVFVQMFHNDGDFEGVGSSHGSVTISAVTTETVAGEISYDYTDDDGRTFGIAGSFEVVHCAP